MCRRHVNSAKASEREAEDQFPSILRQHLISYVLAHGLYRPNIDYTK